jgi:tryptophan halogenase
MNVVIVGGGTAGWMTALYAQIIYPDTNIVLIESDEIGILGAGEGTTPHLVGFFDFLGIPFSDLVKNCNATIKNGIKFTNWSANTQYYYHPFASYSSASETHSYRLNPFIEKDTCFSLIYSAQLKHKFNEHVFYQQMSDNFCVPFIENDKINVSNPLEKFDNYGLWSLHFDARVLAKFLRQVGESRGIKRVEGVVKEIKNNDDNYITSLVVNDIIIPVDFVFDCSGFRRLIIGDFYKSKWKSHAKHLPAKRAIPFFLPIDKKIPPYTESIAMNYGWMWKIPLQHRYGCGYVFDSDFISDDEAKREIDQYIGFETDSPKTFSFNAGCYEKVWIKNCLAIGLSAGFLEPLEATSLWQAVSTLKYFFTLHRNIDNVHEYVRDGLNQTYLLATEEIVDFIYIHYLTNKQNTDFWKNFKINNKTPEAVEYLLELVKDGGYISNSKYLEQSFSVHSYYHVMYGQGILTNEQLLKYAEFLPVDHTQEYLKILEEQKITVPYCTNHYDFLQKLKH